MAPVALERARSLPIGPHSRRFARPGSSRRSCSRWLAPLVPPRQDRQRRPDPPARGLRPAAARRLGRAGDLQLVPRPALVQGGGGGRILGAAVVAVGVLYALRVPPRLAPGADAARPDAADREPRARASSGRPRTSSSSRAGSRSSSPPTTRRRTSRRCSAPCRTTVCGLHLHADRGRRRLGGRHDRAGPGARAPPRCTSRSTAARAPRSAPATGSRSRPGASLVVTMDADGQHQPSRAPAARRADPGREGRRGRRLARARRRPTRRTPRASSGSRSSPGCSRCSRASRVTDPACGYRAVRTEALRGLEFRQDQFHNSEFILEASKRKLRIDGGAGDGHEPALGRVEEAAPLPLRPGFANALLRAWLR